MPSKNPAQRLRDIVENVDVIATFTKDLNFESFRTDRKTVYAVVRALEIISEASRRLPAEMLRRHPERRPAISTGTSMMRLRRVGEMSCTGSVGRAFPPAAGLPPGVLRRCRQQRIFAREAVLGQMPN